MREKKDYYKPKKPTEINPNQADWVADGQMGDGFCLDNINKDEKSGVFTADRFRRLRPESYAFVCELLAVGIGCDRIARMIGCSNHTVLAILRSGDHLSDKVKMGLKFKSVSDLALDRVSDVLLDENSDISARDLMVIAGIANQHGELLLGGVTNRTESMQVVVTHEQVSEMLNGMGLGREKGGQKGEKEGEIIDVNSDPVGPRIDSESIGNPHE